MEMPGVQTLSLTTRDEASKIVDIYKRELSGKGWKLEGSFGAGEQSALTYKKGDQTVLVSVTAREGGAEISLTVATEEKPVQERRIAKTETTEDEKEKEKDKDKDKE
jgi:hypothetical protein